MAAKRTAFGDVSNTVKNLGTIQDDMAITGKSVYQEIVKPVAPLPEKRCVRVEQNKTARQHTSPDPFLCAPEQGPASLSNPSPLTLYIMRAPHSLHRIGSLGLISLSTPHSLQTPRQPAALQQICKR